MANGIEALRRIQIGQEPSAAQGTPVTCTALYRGVGVPSDDTEYITPAENIGIVPGTDRNYVAQEIGTIAWAASPATFEQLAYILNSGMHTAAASQDGAGSGYVREWTGPTTAIYSASDLTTLTQRAGDNNLAEEMPFCFVPDFTLAGKYSEAVTIEANWRGSKWTASTFDAGLTVPAVEEILFNKGKFYIDDCTGTIGSTQVASTLLSFNLAVTTGWMAQPTADGTTTFTLLKQVMPEAELSFTYEHNASAASEKALWRSKTPRQFRLKFEGSALTSAGTYTYKTFIVDAVGRYSTFASLESDNGNDTVTATVKVRYNSDAAKFLNFLLVNQLTTLP